MAERGTRLSETWVPTDKDIAYAETLGMSQDQIEIEARKFFNYWTAKAGAAATKVNWHRTWQNWLLKDHKPTGKPKSMTSDIERLRTVAEYVRKPFYEFGRARPEDLYACVKADLLTMEEAKEAGL